MLSASRFIWGWKLIYNGQAIKKYCMYSLFYLDNYLNQQIPVRS